MNLANTLLGATILASGLAAAPAFAQSTPAANCEFKVGAVLSLTGSIAAIGTAIADVGQLAVDHMNAAGGVNGCRVRYVLRDDQGQPNVGLDAAKALVEIDRVPAIAGAISTGVSLPILTSVTVPGRVTQVSCCSSAPNFTDMAKKGDTKGYFFRTVPTNEPLAVVYAKNAIERGWKKISVIYVNNDYGASLGRSFKGAIEEFGGTVTKMVPYNPEQPSYRAEVTQAMDGNPDAMFLISFPADGATATREWISLGGTQNLILANALRVDPYVAAVGAKFLEKSYGLDNAQVSGPSVDAFNAAYREKFGKDPNGPGLHTQYDAVATILLAAEAAGAGHADGTGIRDNIRKVTGGDGVEVVPGVAGFKAAKAALAAGKSIRYVGATGPLKFDENGDVSGPLLVWGVKDGKLTTLDTWTNERVNAAMAEYQKK